MTYKQNSATGMFQKWRCFVRRTWWRTVLQQWSFSRLAIVLCCAAVVVISIGNCILFYGYNFVFAVAVSLISCKDVRNDQSEMFRQHSLFFVILFWLKSRCAWNIVTALACNYTKWHLWAADLCVFPWISGMINDIVNAKHCVVCFFETHGRSQKNTGHMRTTPQQQQQQKTNS